MEFLFTNSSAWPVVPAFLEVNDLTWGSLNGDTTSVPPSAWSLKDAPRYPRHVGPIGLHSEFDWAFSATWYKRDEHWRAFNPRPTNKEAQEWFGQTEELLDLTAVGDNGDAFMISDDWIRRCKENLTIALDCCRQLRESRKELHNSPIPIHFSFDRLLSTFPSTDDAVNEAEDAKRAMIDAMGYIAWWISVYLKDGEDLVIPYFSEGWVRDLVSKEKRGVLIDLNRDWKEVNISHLVTNNIPVFYPWTIIEASQERFARLSPGFASMYRARLTMMGLSQESNAISYEDITTLQYAYPFIDRYDILLQRKDTEFVPDPNRFRLDDRRPDVFVCDGEGWKRRQIYTEGEKAKLRNTMHFTALDEGLRGTLVYWRWRPILSSDGTMPWTDRELLANREINKLRYAPLPGISYDLETAMEIRTSRRPTLHEITRQAFETARLNLPRYQEGRKPDLPDIIEEEPHKRKTQEEYHEHRQDKRNRSNRRESMALARSPSPYRWERRLQQDRGRMARHERDFRTDHPKQDRSTWNSMSQQLALFYPRDPSSVFTTPVSSRPDSRISLEDRLTSPGSQHYESSTSFRDGLESYRSESPDHLGPVEADNEGETDVAANDEDRSPSPGREYDWAMRADRHYGRFSQAHATYKVPDEVFWNALFIDCGTLEIPDPRNQLRLQLWANTDSSLIDERDLLIKAVAHGIRFRITVPGSEIERFRPREVTTDDMTAGFYYAKEYIEPDLTWDRGGADFLTKWRTRVKDILGRPHASVVVFAGGPLHWIARKFKADLLIAAAFKGPSVQVTVHQVGFLNAKLPGYPRADELSSGEERTIYGFMGGSSPDKDRTLFPTEAMLDEYLDHYTGQWNNRCESIFETIWSNIHDRGSIKAYTPGQWKQFL